jgi:uncharacterized protein (UPF0548 family)
LTRPAGYHHLRHRTYLGRGVLPASREALFEWRMHEAAGLRVPASTPRAAPGVTVVSGLGWGPLRVEVPCRVVWTEVDGDRVGFGYGTLPGHPERGEEAFVLTHTGPRRGVAHGHRLQHPARWYARAAEPVATVLQRWVARRYGRALRRLLPVQRGLGEHVPHHLRVDTDHPVREPGRLASVPGRPRQPARVLALVPRSLPDPASDSLLAAGTSHR